MAMADTSLLLRRKIKLSNRIQISQLSLYHILKFVASVLSCIFHIYRQSEAKFRAPMSKSKCARLVAGWRGVQGPAQGSWWVQRGKLWDLMAV